MQMEASALKRAAKEIATYVFIIFLTYFAGIIIHIVLGFIEEDVLPNLGLNASGTAYSAVTTMITSARTGVNAVVAIATVIVGLLTLNVVLTAFGIKLNFSMGGRV